MEKVLKWMKANNLYIKLEEYVWKLRNIMFLGEELKVYRVRRKKKKIKGVLE